MDLDQEINYLLDIMPASGRMYLKVVSKPQQSKVIEAPFPLPWNLESRPIYINFDLWKKLSRQQRDLLFLQGVSSLLQIQWFKPDVYQGVTLVGLAGITMQIMQGDAVGVVVAGSLTALAANQIWRKNRLMSRQLEADEKAILVALRRGYNQVEAATHLLEAIEVVAELENRPGLDFSELIRSQNLKAMANLSSVGVPPPMRS